MRLVEFQTQEGTLVFVNPEAVSRVEEINHPLETKKTASRIYFIGEDEPIVVLEEAEAAVDQLQAGG